MNWYQDVVFNLMDKLRGRKNIERLKFLRTSQYWGKEKLENWQLARLNELLVVARKRSSFHRERLKDIALPLTSTDELQNVPTLTKAEIRSHLDEIKCIDTPEYLFIKGKTGGSTGEPMHYYYDKRGRDWNRGCVYRSQEWAGTYLGERTVQMTGSHYDYTEFKKLKWQLIFWLQRYRSMPVSLINDELFEHYYEELIDYKPSSIWGYASGVYYFAKFISEKHPGADFSFLKAIITSSETLYDHQRKKINSIFGEGKVYDHYGSREFYIASECSQHSGYHIHAETVLVEVVDNNGKKKKPGELGRILITDLSNQVFPFIRYEIGDVGIMSDEVDCPCGVRLPKLAKVEGRIAEVIVLQDRMLTPPNFTILLSDFEGIDQYQIIQKEMTKLLLRLVTNEKYTPEYERYIRTSIQELAGPKVTIEIEYPRSIETPLSGKRRYIISEVSRGSL